MQRTFEDGNIYETNVPALVSATAALLQAHDTLVIVGYKHSEGYATNRQVRIARARVAARTLHARRARSDWEDAAMFDDDAGYVPEWS